MGRGFPYLLATQYLLAGVGAVLGVLTAAFTTTVIREERMRKGVAKASAAAGNRGLALQRDVGGSRMHNNSQATQSYAFVTYSYVDNSEAPAAGI